MIATEIGARPDELEGTTVMSRAVALVEWSERNARLVQLTARLALHRPEADWE